MKLLGFLCCLAPGTSTARDEDFPCDLCASAVDDGICASSLFTASLKAANRHATAATYATDQKSRAAQQCADGDAGCVLAPSTSLESCAQPAQGACQPAGLTARQATTAAPSIPGGASAGTLSAGKEMPKRSLASPKQAPDRMTVAREGLQQLMMDLRFRPEEDLQLAVFCPPSCAGAAPGMPAAAAAAAAVAGSTNDCMLLRPQPRASLEGGAPAAAATPGATFEIGKQLVRGAAPPQQQLWRLRRARSRSTEDSKITNGGYISAPRPPPPPRRGGRAAATADTAAAAATAIPGGISIGYGGGTGVDSGSQPRLVSDCSGMSPARAWTLQSVRSLRPCTKLLSPSSAAVAGATAAPPLVFAAAMRTSSTSSAASASSASLSHVLVRPLPATDVKGSRGSTAETEADGGAARGERRQRCTFSNGGSTRMPASLRPCRMCGGSDQEPRVMVSGAALCGGTTQIGATQIGTTQISGDVGHGHGLCVALLGSQPLPQPQPLLGPLVSEEDGNDREGRCLCLMSEQILRKGAPFPAAAAASIGAPTAAAAAAAAALGDASTAICDSILSSTPSVGGGRRAEVWGADSFLGAVTASYSELAHHNATQLLVHKSAAAVATAIRGVAPASTLVRGGGGTAAAAAAAAASASCDIAADTDWEAAMAAAAFDPVLLRRSASVPSICLEQREELLGALGACIGNSGGVVRTCFLTRRSFSVISVRPTSSHRQSKLLVLRGLRAPLPKLPPFRRCDLNQATFGAAAAISTWRTHHRTGTSWSKGGLKYRSGSRCEPLLLLSGAGAGGGGCSSGCSSVLFSVGGVAGDSSGGKDSGSGGRGPPPLLPLTPRWINTTAAAAGACVLPADVMPYSRAALGQDVPQGPVEARGFAAAAAGAVQRPYPPYASKLMSQMALMPFLQQQQSSHSIPLQVIPTGPVSFNLGALSREITGLRWIGQGGGGPVFQGLWQGVPVAIKFLLTEADGRLDAAALEGVVSTVVHHPNILRTYAFECCRLTEATFNEELPHSSLEEGGTELLESLLETCATLSDSVARRARAFQGVAAGCGGGGGSGGGSLLHVTHQRPSRLGVPSFNELVSAQLAAVSCSGDWASAAASGAVVAAPLPPISGHGRARAVPVGAPTYVAGTAAAPPAATDAAADGDSGSIPYILRQQPQHQKLLQPPPFPVLPAPASPSRNVPSVAARIRLPGNHLGGPPVSSAAAAAASDAASDADADLDIFIASSGGRGGGSGGEASGRFGAVGSTVVATAAAGLTEVSIGNGAANGGSYLGGGVAAAGAAWAAATKLNSAFQSGDGFGDPEAGLGSQCWTVRQVLSYLKARPSMYMTYIIMEYCDRGSLLAAIKRGVFRTDVFSTWPYEEGSLGAGGRCGGGGAAAAAAAGSAWPPWTASASFNCALAAPPSRNTALATADTWHCTGSQFGSLAAGRRVALRALLRTARDVAQGMCHLHANGIIHGDLKPGNVLLRGCRSDRRGFVAVVSDFGLSKVTRGEKPLDLNHWSTVTVMAPEVINGTWLKASDVFSFGILLWQLATGEIMPYGTCTVPQILVGVSQGTLKPEWPSASCHPALVRLGRACLATNPDKRPSFEAIVKMLTKIEKDVRSQVLLQPPQTGSSARKAGPTATVALAATHGGGVLQRAMPLTGVSSSRAGRTATAAAAPTDGAIA